MKLASNRQMRQSQYDAVYHGDAPAPPAVEKGKWPCSQFSDMVLVLTAEGRGRRLAFQESRPDVLSERVRIPLRTWLVGKSRDRVHSTNAAILRRFRGRFLRIGRSSRPAKKRLPAGAGARSVTALEGSVLRRFGSFVRSV